MKNREINGADYCVKVVEICVLMFYSESGIVLCDQLIERGTCLLCQMRITSSINEYLKTAKCVVYL